MARLLLYLRLDERLVRLERDQVFERSPIVGEFVQVWTAGILPLPVTEVLHTLDGTSEISLQGPLDGYENGADLDDAIKDLLESGWRVASDVRRSSISSSPSS